MFTTALPGLAGTIISKISMSDRWVMISSRGIGTMAIPWFDEMLSPGITCNRRILLSQPAKLVNSICNDPYYPNQFWFATDVGVLVIDTAICARSMCMVPTLFSSKLPFRFSKADEEASRALETAAQTNLYHDDLFRVDLDTSYFEEAVYHLHPAALCRGVFTRRALKVVWTDTTIYVIDMEHHEVRVVSCANVRDVIILHNVIHLVTTKGKYGQFPLTAVAAPVLRQISAPSDFFHHIRLGSTLMAHQRDMSHITVAGTANVLSILNPSN
jgi:hypothetical protein